MSRPAPTRRARWRGWGVLVTALVVVTVLTLLGAGFEGAGPLASLRAGPATAVAPTTTAPTPELPPDTAPGLVLGTGGGSIVPVAAVLADLLTARLDDPRLGPDVRGEVVDVTSGAVLFARAAADPAVPASTTKLTTALAVELAVAPGTRIPTRVVRGVGPGQIVLVGGGDPTLARDPERTLYPGAGSIAALAAQVRAAGGAAVTSILVDGALYTGPEVAPGWGSGDAPSSYAAPITAVMVDGGRTSPRDPGRRSDRPDLAAGQALAQALGVPDVPVEAGRAPAQAPQLGRVVSPPIEQLVEIMLRDSDNVLAEALARQVALAVGQSASYTGAVTAVRATLQAAGLDLTGLELSDGSGLSTLDRIPPRLLVDILLRATADDAARGLLSGLPVAGYDGTLTGRYPTSTADGEVRAKTGTLDGVSALAGLVRTADGALLVFAFVADGVPLGGRYPAEDALDQAAAVLAACGCR